MIDGQAHRTVWAIAGPAMLINVSVALIGLVDAWVAGQLGGAAPLAAVAAATTLLNSLFWSVNFLRTGTTALTAQAVGAADEQERQLVLARAGVLALALGLLLLVLSPLLVRHAVPLLGVGGQVLDLAQDYAAIRLAAAPLVLVNMAMAGWLMGQGRARATLAIEISYNLANTALSIALGLWMGLGVAGIAIASVAAEGLKLAIFIGLAHRLTAGQAWPDGQRLLAGAAMGRLLLVNRDLFLRTALLMLCLFWFTRTSALMGPAVLAANHIVMQLNQMQILLLDGFESAAQVLGGQRVGARDRAGFVLIARTSLAQAFVLALVLALSMALVGPVLAHSFSAVPEVRANAATVWSWLWVLPMLGFFIFTVDGLFIGASWTGGMLLSMLAGAIGFAAVLALGDGLQTPWIALAAMLLLRAILLGLLLPGSVRRSFTPQAGA